jgi:hypothetical protein
MRREKTHISKIRNAKGRYQQTPWKSMKSSETTLRPYILKNLKNLKKRSSKLNQEDINHLNRSITQNEIEAAIESPKKEKSRT